MPHPTPASTPATPVSETADPLSSINWLDLPVESEYKHDGRSHVWQVRLDDGRRFVVKRYEGSTRWQRILWHWGHHPAQREARWVRQLNEMALPVVRIQAAGFDEGRAWIVTPYRGETLHKWIRRGQLIAARDRQTIARQLGHILGQLTHAKVLHRDAKASNFVIDDDRQVRLIDVGGCRGAKGIPILGISLRMLTSLHETINIAARRADDPAARIQRSDRLRCYLSLLRSWPRFPDGLQHLPRNAEFRDSS